jgi:hypothetical protein
MNQLNKSLHSPTENVFTSSNKILGIKLKLNPWKNHVVKADLEMVPQLLRIESEDVYQQISSLIKNHLKKLQNNIKHYFLSLSTQMEPLF